jgi:hypothetical protein
MAKTWRRRGATSIHHCFYTAQLVSESLITAAQPRVAPAIRAGGDMDDTPEQPKHSPNLKTSGTGEGDQEQDSSGDEDGGLDWTKLPYVHPPLDHLQSRDRPLAQVWGTLPHVRSS